MEPEPHASESTASSEAQERSRRLAELLREWMAEEDGYDERVWPLIEEELANSRTRIGQ